MDERFPVAFRVKAKNGVLQKFIDDRGWNQSDFARAMGKSAVVVGLWFNMKKYPHNKETIDKLCKLVRLPLDYIFPPVLRHPSFMDAKKSVTVYQEIDFSALPAPVVGQLESPDVVDALIESEFKKELYDVLDTLTEREKSVIMEYFGFEGASKSITEIAKKLELGKARVSQILRKALSRLQHPSRANRLKEFVQTK